MNSLPSPGPSLRASIEPPCSSVSRLASASPMPSPPWARSAVVSPWVNSSKTRESSASVMPMPVSVTVIATWRFLAPAPFSTSTLRWIRPLRGRELAGVVQDVREDLPEAGGVHVHDVGLGRQLRRELDPRGLDGRALPLDGAEHQLGERRRPPLQHDLPRRDA